MDKGRVLFVDDEAQVLRSLKRMLRLHCKDWELFFFSSPGQALSEITDIQPWIIVSDKRMAEMSGEDFLVKAKALNPSSVRVILTGDTSTDAAVAALRAAHLLLAKPFELEDLLEVLERAACLRDFTVDEQLREQVGSLQALPVLPVTYQQLISYLDSVDSPDNNEIAGLMTKDVAVLSKVIQLANSSFWGFSQPVYSAKDAIIRLGHELIKKVVLCVGLFSSLDTQAEYESLFNQAEKVATKMRQLAVFSKQPAEEVERAYFTGLLHNVGAVVKESDKTALSQDLIGAFLLHLWGFESTVVNAVRYQSVPQSMDQDDFLAYQLCFAKVLVEAESKQVPAAELMTSLDNYLIEKTDLVAYLRSQL